MATFTQWQGSDQYPAGDAPFRAAETGGPEPVFRDQMDALRSMYRRTPSAEFPDGYLGTVESQRRDRLRHEGNLRHNNKPYNRGVHKGERLDSSDYFWPDVMQPTDGLVAQMNGVKYAPPGVLMEAGMLPVQDPRGQDPHGASLARVGVPRGGTAEWGRNPDRSAKMAGMLPPWAGPGMGVGTAYAGR